MKRKVSLIFNIVFSLVFALLLSGTLFANKAFAADIIKRDTGLSVSYTVTTNGTSTTDLNVKVTWNQSNQDLKDKKVFYQLDSNSILGSFPTTSSQLSPATLYDDDTGVFELTGSISIPSGNQYLYIWVEPVTSGSDKIIYVPSEFKVTGGNVSGIQLNESTLSANSKKANELSYKFTNISTTSFTLTVSESSNSSLKFDGNIYYLVVDKSNNGVVYTAADIMSPKSNNNLKNYAAKGSKYIKGESPASISVTNLNPGKNYLVYMVVQIGNDNYYFSDDLGNTNGTPFSTSPFPSLTKFSIENKQHIDSNDPLSVIKGVTAQREGEIEIQFETSIALVNEGAGIKLLEMSTREDFKDTNKSGTENGCKVSSDGKTLTVYYKSLNPTQQYTLVIDPGEIKRDDSGVPGAFNASLSSIVFYTEKRPSLVNVFFNPGSEPVNFERSPFYMSNTNPIYQIPDLIGVNKIGVGVNQALVLSFDDKIKMADDILSKIKIDRSPYHSDLRYTAELSDNGMDLLITFDTDHPDRMLNFNTKYTVTILAGAISDAYGGEHSENEDIKIIFKTVDGFSNAFLNSSAQDLNNGIFRDYSTHNIAVKVPKVYIKQLETIYYRNGLIPDEQVAPNLTNIDIDADEDVAYIKVVTNRGVRPKVYRSSNNKFSVAFAGLNADISNIEIYAYDSYGKILESRSFKLQGAPGAEYKNDYVPEITEVFGKTISFYDLMKDPTMLQQIVEQIPLSELDRIGVFYPYFSPYDLIE